MQYALVSRETLTSSHKDFLQAFRPTVPILKIWGNRHWLMWESYFLLKMTRWMNIYIPIQSWKLLGFGWFTCVGTWWAWMQHALTSRWTLTSDYQNLTSLFAHSSYFENLGNWHWLMWGSYFLVKMTRWMNIYLPIKSWKLLGFGWFTFVCTWWAWM